LERKKNIYKKKKQIGKKAVKSFETRLEMSFKNEMAIENCLRFILVILCICPTRKKTAFFNNKYSHAKNKEINKSK